MNHPVQRPPQAFSNAPSRRRLLAGAAAALTASMLAASAGAAEPYPGKPIRLVVPYTPGQGADSAAASF